MGDGGSEAISVNDLDCSGCSRFSGGRDFRIKHRHIVNSKDLCGNVLPNSEPWSLCYLGLLL